MQCNWVVVVFPGGSSTRQLQIGIRYTLPDVHVLHPKIHPSWLCVCSAMANQQSQAGWAIPTAMLQLLCHGFAMTTFPLFGWSVVRAENQINTKHSPLTSLTTLSLYNSSPMLHQHIILLSIGIRSHRGLLRLHLAVLGSTGIELELAHFSRVFFGAGIHSHANKSSSPRFLG